MKATVFAMRHGAPVATDFDDEIEALAMGVLLAEAGEHSLQRVEVYPTHIHGETKVYEDHEIYEHPAVQDLL